MNRIDSEMEEAYWAQADEVSERYAATVADMELFNKSEDESLEREAYEADVAIGFVGDRVAWRAHNQACFRAAHAYNRPVEINPFDDDILF